MVFSKEMELRDALAENRRLIRRTLASINIHKPELDAMLEAYEKSVLQRMNLVDKGGILSSMGTPL